ncbi:MAG: hypothetical protein H7Z72_02320 [Bacteroidetes bacterium]|nr:hypothetical protein [Fibrella sp.]
MKGNATMLKAEALLRFVCYTSPDRKCAAVMGDDCWVDKQTALGSKFALNTEHDLTFLLGDRESSRYTVAMLPLIRRVVDPRGSGNPVVHVTIYLARTAELALFASVEELTLTDVRNSMLRLDE